MNKILKKLDRKVRMDKNFPELKTLRTFFRKPYHWLLNTYGQGAEIKVGGLLPVIIPAEFGSREVELYEIESVAAIAEWLQQEYASLFIDIGCSLGYLSCGVILNSSIVQVIAIDSDIHSLAATKRLCTFKNGFSNRLELLNCFIGPSGAGESTIEKIENDTCERLKNPDITGNPGTTNYVNLDKNNLFSNMTTVTLDQILESRSASKNIKGRACLVKCDIEGAEELMLKGAHRALSVYKVWMLLSVHPQYMENFDSSKSNIADIFNQYNYTIEVLSIDHEEHWLCKPKL